MDQAIAVLYISEYDLVASGLSAYLVDHPLIKFSGNADSIATAINMLAEGCDVAIVDLTLLKASGLSDIKLLLKQDPGLKIIVLSRNEREPFITQSIENGALGYISLKCSQSELIEAIQTVYRNERYLSRDVAYGYAMASLNKNDSALSSLTTREYQVFTMLAKGSSIADIASALFISPKTVHVYRANIFSKLKLSNAYELTLLALRQGVISVDVIES